MDQLIDHLNRMKVNNNGHSNIFVPYEKKCDLSKKSIVELKQMAEKQEKLLANKSFLSNLPDKGDKVRVHHARLMQVIDEKECANLTHSLVDQLQLNKKSKSQYKILPNQPTLEIKQETDDNVIEDSYVSALSLTMDEKEVERMLQQQVSPNFKTNQVGKVRVRSQSESDNGMETESKTALYLNDGNIKHFSPAKPIRTLSLTESLVFSKDAQSKEKEIAQMLANKYPQLNHVPDLDQLIIKNINSEEEDQLDDHDYEDDFTL